MKTKDFENAIVALNCTVCLDEIVKRTFGEVVSAYGHMKQLYLKWDDMGRGFSCQSDDPLPENQSVEVRMEVEHWERDFAFDLKFE